MRTALVRPVRVPPSSPLRRESARVVPPAAVPRPPVCVAGMGAGVGAAESAVGLPTVEPAVAVRTTLPEAALGVIHSPLVLAGLHCIRRVRVSERRAYGRLADVLGAGVWQGERWGGAGISQPAGYELT